MLKRRDCVSEREGVLFKKMRDIHVIVATAVACLGIVEAHAQTSTPVGPYRTLSFQPLIEDTSKYSPQIDSKFVPHPERPENPVEIDPDTAERNSLPVGQVRNVLRGIVGPQWPAIGATGWNPPDPDLAVGPNHVVAVVNMSLAFFEKNGTQIFQQTAQTFFSGLAQSDFLFDPKCFYDRIHGRYVMLFLERDTSPQISKLLIAVSDDNNPVGTWFKYRVEAKMILGGTSYWLDYPGFGFNKDALLISGNMFSFGNQFWGVQFIAVPTAPLLSGGTATAKYFSHENASTTQIAEIISPTATKAFGIARRGSSNVRMYGFSDLAGASPTMVFTEVGVPTNSAPQVNATSTNGNTLDSLDGRLFNATWRDGQLVTSHTVQSGSLLRVRWYQIATNNWPDSGSPSLTQSGEVASGSAHHHMPAVSLNSLGDISTIFTRSSTSITADIMYAGRFASDPAGTMGTPVNLESSIGNNYGAGRWGDYFGVDVDPVDDVTFWGIAMNVAVDNNWKAGVFSWTISTPGTLVAPNSITMDRGSILSGGVAELLSSDDARLQLRPGVTFSSNEYPVTARIAGVSPIITPSSIRLTLESQATSSNLAQRVEMFVHETGTWEQLNLSNCTVNTDGTIEIDVTTDPNRFVDASGNIVARVSYRATGAVFAFPWTGKIDQLVWRIVP